MASLYKDLVRARIPTDHHESDLYVLDTPEARETIKKYGYKFTTFTSDIDRRRWIDVPFAYEPFWEKKKEQSRRSAPSGTVKAATSKRAHAAMKDNKTRYAVVVSQGRYGSGERVRAARVFGDRREALKAAGKMTREFQAGMKRYGGSSGGYRVVETDARTSRDAVWLGHALDRMPSIH